jgi:hypothetical protein
VAGLQQHGQAVGQDFTADVGLAQSPGRVTERRFERIAAWTTLMRCRL